MEHIDEEPALSQEEKDALKSVGSVILAASSKARSGTAVESLYACIHDSGYLAHLSKEDTEGNREALNYLNQIFDTAKRFQLEYPSGHLRELLDYIRLEQEAGDAGTLQRDMESGPDTVKIMTIHGSKGLEFRYVFIVNMVDRRFPVTERQDAIELPISLEKERRQMSDEAHLEEERRLFYVALTRGKEGVFLTSAEDYGGARSRKPSRFLIESGILSPAVMDRRQEKIVRPTPQKTTIRSVQESTQGFHWKLPTVVSFTQLKAFQTCPLQYKYAFLLKLPTFGRYQFSFGKSIHAALEAYFKEFLESERLPSQQRLLELYETLWIGEWYPSQKEKEEYFEKGKEILTRMYQEMASETPRPLAIEQDFTLKFGEGEQMITLKGRIDRIDGVEGGSEIIDYKTGKSKAIDTLRSDDKEQLIIYQIAAEDVLGLQPKKLTYYYVEDGSRVSFLGTEKEKDKIRVKVSDTVAKMQESSFSATPGFHCNYCDFKSICEYRTL